MKAALSCLSNARMGIGWGTIGAAMACYDCARQYTMMRTQFDNRPIASHQLVQNELAFMITEITKAQFMTLHASRLKDKGKLHFSHVSMLKRNNAQMAIESPAAPATCWAPTASPTNIRFSGTCAISKR